MNQNVVVLRDNFLVHNPESNCTYRCISSQLNGREVQIILTGNPQHTTWIDLSTHRMHFVKEICRFIYVFFDSFIVIPIEALPFNKTIKNLTPLLIYSEFSGVIAVNQLTYNIERYAPIHHQTTASNTPNVINISLQEDCRKLLKNVEVVTGKLPMFEDIRPSFEVLSEIYQQFIQYNNNNKLQYQNEQTKDLCHIRAHFINVLLDQYRIPSLKAYKFWGQDNHQSFSDHEQWSFHCAVMIPDRENQYWIWDPWIGLNQQLLSLKQWMTRRITPLSFKLLITNKVIIQDVEEGLQPEEPYFMEIGKPEHIRAFQAVCSNAIPPPLEYPLSCNSNEDAKIEDEH